MGFQFQSVGAVSPLLMSHLRITNADLGLLIGLFSLPGVVLALPGGLLGERFGDRRLVVLSLVLMTFGSALIGATDTFSIAAVGRSLTAIGAVMFNVLATKMVADWFAGREIIWAMAVFINAWPIGIGMALFILPLVASLWGLAVAFYVAAVLAAAGAVAITMLYPGGISSHSRIETLALAALSRREIALVTLAAVPWMLFNVGYALMLGFVPTLLASSGYSVEQAGAVLGIGVVLSIVSVQVGGAMAQWVARPDAIVALGLLGYSAALSVLPYVPPVPTLIVVGVVSGLPAASLVSAPAGVLRAESRAAGMGLFYTWYYAGMALLPAAAGWLQDVAGGTAAVHFAAVTILLALPSFLVFRAAAAEARHI